MYKFVDEISIFVKAGNGGPGCISFRREKYVPAGGPDGGNGGAGGNVLFQADPQIINLAHLHNARCYSAGHGNHASGRNRDGKDGEPVIVKVPMGTVLSDLNGKVLHDFTDLKPFEYVTGGRGGKGNAHFKSSTFRSPKFAQPGEVVEKVQVSLSLKIIADVGFIGLPNAGKSTLLHTLTQANPKIANYPFTTLSPNLGTLELSHDKSCTVADIPGIIEGASKGHGLGLSFLKHIERVRLLVFVLDITTAHVTEELEVLRQELEEYNPVLNKRPFILVFNKCDLIEPEFADIWMDSFRKDGYDPVPISALNNEGIDALKAKILEKI
ncbi:MAG: GTPase ObgE [Leptospirales bacterium]